MVNIKYLEARIIRLEGLLERLLKTAPIETITDDELSSLLEASVRKQALVLHQEIIKLMLEYSAAFAASAVKFREEHGHDEGEWVVSDLGKLPEEEVKAS